MTRQELCELIDLAGDEIYSFCYNLTQNRENAEDLYQEAFLKTAEKLEKIDIADNPKSFILSIAVGIYRNSKKKYAIRNRIMPEVNFAEGDYPYVITSEETGPEDVILTKECVETVQRITNQLDVKYRLPVYMYYTTQMSIEEIAAALHIPKGTVKSRLHKARILMKKGLEDCGYER